jgi:hypothetical protein
VEGSELEVLAGLQHSIPLVSLEFHLTLPDIAKTRACLDRLAQFGPAHANLTHGETAAWQLPDWIPLEQFRQWFPGALDGGYGDIFVRVDA